MGQGLPVGRPLHVVVDVVPRARPREGQGDVPTGDAGILLEYSFDLDQTVDVVLGERIDAVLEPGEPVLVRREDLVGMERPYLGQ